MELEANLGLHTACAMPTPAAAFSMAGPEASSQDSISLYRPPAALVSYSTASWRQHDSAQPLNGINPRLQNLLPSSPEPSSVLRRRRSDLHLPSHGHPVVMIPIGEFAVDPSIPSAARPCAMATGAPRPARTRRSHLSSVAIGNNGARLTERPDATLTKRSMEGPRTSEPIRKHHVSSQRPPQ